MAELNQKVDSVISLLQNWDVVVLNILQNLEGNGLEQVAETLGIVYVPLQVDDNRLTYVTLDT